MKKRILAGILCLVMAGSLFAGCGKDKTEDKPGEAAPEENQTADATKEETPAEPTKEDVTATPTPTQAPVAPETETKSQNIYVILPEIDEGESAKEAAIIKQKAQEYGYSVVLCEHDGEADEQSEYFAQAIRENAQGIICDNASAQITAESVNMAKEAGIPTILLNRGIDEEGLAVSQILTDSATAASQLAGAFLENFMGGGSYVELLGSTENIDAFNATSAFHTDADMDQTVFMDRQEIGDEYNEDDAEAKIRQMLTDSPDSRGIVCYNGMMADAAVDVVEDMGKTDMVIVCLSADEEAEELVREKKIFAAAIKPAEQLAQLSIEQMNKFLTEGSTGSPEEVQYVEGSVIRSDSMN